MTIGKRLANSQKVLRRAKEGRLSALSKYRDIARKVDEAELEGDSDIEELLSMKRDIYSELADAKEEYEVALTETMELVKEYTSQANSNGDKDGDKET